LVQHYGHYIRQCMSSEALPFMVICQPPNLSSSLCNSRSTWSVLTTLPSRHLRTLELRLTDTKPGLPPTNIHATSTMRSDAGCTVVTTPPDPGNDAATHTLYGYHAYGHRLHSRLIHKIVCGSCHGRCGIGEPSRFVFGAMHGRSHDILQSLQMSIRGHESWCCLPSGGCT
jgi:hypothetical protein